MVPLRFCLFLLLALGGWAETLRVMTFNVRYPNPGDGADVWTARRALFCETVRNAAPDLMGTQELFYDQGEDIVRALPEYRWFGLSRRGNREDEHMGVFYRPDRLKLLDSGHFWLSETPDKPGSMSWNVSLPRMVTWGIFELTASGRRFLYYNTHLAHRNEDEEARQASARVIQARLSAADPKMDFLLTGDFNSPADGGTYKVLAPPLRDAWKEAVARTGPEGTFHGFKGKPGPARIDWILFRAPWKVQKVETLDSHKGERYPSDHFPVLAVFELP
jgi:endonuclease/exonuclease/phosphatase family metal-dependent hydrolase